jgi:hypothetical protein
MLKQHTRIDAACLRGLVLAGAMLALHGCSSDPDTDSEEQPAVTPAPEPTPAPGPGSSSPISQLPFVDAAANTQLAGEVLAQATALGETTALHVRLPPPRNTALTNSLVRIVGETGNPQLLFRSDALRQLGVISTSPGSDFFTAFSQLSKDELTKSRSDQDQIAAGAFGQTTTESVLFSGRGATARTANPRIDPNLFRPGIAFPVNRCFIRPVSTLAAWGKALFITDPAIVLDPARTWDPCTGAGTQGGVWTFAHLIREMANGSGRTPEQFALEWLSNWLNDYVVNSDTVNARTQMFNQVIQPWATASGVVATLVIDPITGKRRVTLTGPLNLNIAPFRLLAIVNRIDLGATARGGGGYGGSTTSLPVTAGELRFIFNVVQPNPWGAGTEATCGRKLFTTIFEYGVPGKGCAAVVAWAKRWSSLLAFPGFTPAYKAQLQAMTQSVVVHGAAPTKGNQNAINQIRTNEIALAGPWELREFTLTAENPPANTDPPANGPLRPHTVAQTPDDFAFSAGGADATINAFVQGPVTAGVSLPVVNPLQCAASFTVPYTFLGAPFRGGNAKIPPGHWRANNVTGASPAAEICARHQFSLNTCSGCHQDDSGTNGFPSTNFTHIDVFSSPPVTLSKFLTGGGPGLVFNVPDTQLGAPIWPFADLERRFQRLFDLSHCTTCTSIFTTRVAFLDQIQQFGPVPIDPGPDASFPFRTGPITDLGVVRRILDLRPQFAGATRSEPVDFIRAVDTSAH